MYVSLGLSIILWYFTLPEFNNLGFFMMKLGIHLLFICAIFYYGIDLIDKLFKLIKVKYQEYYELKYDLKYNYKKEIKHYDFIGHTIKFYYFIKDNRLRYWVRFKIWYFDNLIMAISFTIGILGVLGIAFSFIIFT